MWFIVLVVSGVFYFAGQDGHPFPNQAACATAVKITSERLVASGAAIPNDLQFHCVDVSSVVTNDTVVPIKPSETE